VWIQSLVSACFKGVTVCGFNHWCQLVLIFSTCLAISHVTCYHIYVCILKPDPPLMPDPLLSLSSVSKGSTNQIEQILKYRAG
jgi:hypothetical protein